MLATPFLRAASAKYAVTLLAKPYALELHPRLWPQVEVLPFTAPWTAFRGKYQLWRWPWRELWQLRRQLVATQFDFAVSARWDPRDHLLMKLSRARERLGFPRLQSRLGLTQTLTRPDPLAHRSEYWRVAGAALDLKIPARADLIPPSRPPQATVLLHSGARLSARIWPLENCQRLAARLRAKNCTVQIACDPDQLGWWQSRGEKAACPRTVTELLALIDQAGTFIGNDSGPGHLAAICGVPTFTLFGPQLREWFVPLHPAAESFEGHACPYKPCSDYCRYAIPFCLTDVTADEVWPRVEQFLRKHL